MTPLLLASWKGLTEIVCLLIKHNADINATDNYGNTALMKSSRQNHINCVTELIEAGVDITIINNLGSTAYDMAKSPEMSRLLSIYPTDEVSRLQRENSYNRKNSIVNPKVSIDAINIKAENDVKVEELNLLINQLCENMSNENSKIIELNIPSSTSNDNNNDSGSGSGSGSGSAYINNKSLNTSIACADSSTAKEENVSKQQYFADSGEKFPITLEPRKRDSNILSGTFKIPWRSKPENVVIKIPKDDENGLKDLLYEGSVFEKLGSEENTGCVRMYNKGPTYLVFESFYCDLETFTSSKFEIKVSIFQDIISAVKALHSFGIMHGDLKPKNILIKENLDCVKLCDLENARMENEYFRNDGNSLIFTPLWCSPEVFAGDANVLLANRKIDMFSVGLIGASLLSRSRSSCKAVLPSDPSQAAELFSSQARLLDAILPPSEELPINFLEMIKNLCSIDIKNRISSSECYKRLGSTTRVYRENTELKKQNHLLEVEIKQKLDNISDEIEKIIPYMVGQFSVLKTLVTNINCRVVPTSFILLNKEFSGTSQVTSLYRALMHPGDVIQSKFRSLVMNKIFLYFLCEVCFEPQDDYGYPIEVHEPKKNVWKLLPLAQATLVTIKLLNVGLKIGRCFGFPTPVLHDSMLQEASSFLDAFDSKTLLPYQQLQQVVTSSLDLKATDTPNLKDNFTISELEILINREDPQQLWKRFLTRYTLPSGDFLYCCKNCYKKNALVMEDTATPPPPRPPRNSTPPPTPTTHDPTPMSTTPMSTVDENVKNVNEDHTGTATSSSSTSPRMRVKYSPADLAKRKSALASSASSETVQLGADSELILDNKKAPIKKNSNNVKSVNNAPTVYDATNSPTSTLELENRKRGIFDCACS